jgi:septal ring factor EnvC (AmiA/AmiB activator)
MQWLRIIFLFLALNLQTHAIPAPKKMSYKEATEKLTSIAAAIQNYEQQLSAVENDLSQARAEENAILQELGHHNQRLMETIHYLRHATQYSPVLAMLSAPKPEDVIHSSMLLRAVTPEIHYRNQQLLQKVTVLSQIRAKLETKQEELRAITFKYHEERETLDAMINANGSSGRIVNDIPQNTDGKSYLKKPVVGKIIPTYESTKPEWASFTQGILFTTRPEAQVVSPLTGVIVSSGDYAEGQGKIIQIQNSTLLVMMSGLGSLYANCKAGQQVMLGAPIGRMPKKAYKKASSSSMPDLYLEVWHQEQTIDPQSILQD